MMAGRLLFLFTIAMLLFLNCFSDAPHENPLDPANGISLSGRVSRYYSNNAIANATVRLSPGNRIAITNSSGNYQFSEISPGMHTITVLTDGYSSQSAEINIENSTERNFALDSLPYFRDISLTTSHTTRWFPPDDIFSVQVETIGEDGDGSGDIDRVWLQIDQFSFSDTLQQITPGSNIFRGQILTSDLPIVNLQEMIGKPFHFFLKDLPGFTNSSLPQYITRIIDKTPQLISPTGLAIISSDTINFKWQSNVDIHFPFTQKIEIYSIDLGLKVDEVNDIGSDASDYLYTSPFSNGKYYWILYIVDEFGNRSGSKDHAFQVQM